MTKTASCAEERVQAESVAPEDDLYLHLHSRTLRGRCGGVADSVNGWETLALAGGWALPGSGFPPILRANGSRGALFLGFQSEVRFPQSECCPDESWNGPGAGSAEIARSFVSARG